PRRPRAHPRAGLRGLIGRQDRAATCLAIEASDNRLARRFHVSITLAIDKKHADRKARVARSGCNPGRNAVSVANANAQPAPGAVVATAHTALLEASHTPLVGGHPKDQARAGQWRSRSRARCLSAAAVTRVLRWTGWGPSRQRRRAP